MEGISLNITLQDINASLERNKQVRPVNYEKIESVWLERLERSRPPPSDMLAHLSDRVAYIISELAKGEFYDYQVMVFMADLIYAVHYSFGIDKSLLSAKVHGWLTHLEELSRGANGITLTAALGDLLRNDVVVKNPLAGNLTHEVFVGLAGTNSLRKYIPNFSFVYGGFGCAPPVVYNRKVYDYCYTSRKGVNYALYENVQPSVSFDHAIRNGMSVKNFLSSYLQILLSVQKAYELINFTHFDLHCENVLLRKTPLVRITYDLRKELFYVSTRNIATIIDYGFSSFNYSGTQYTNSDGLSPYLGVAQTFPLYDAYKLLTSCYHEARKNNPAVLQVCAKLLSYFSNEDAEILYFVSLENFASLPTTYANLDLMELIYFTISLDPRIVTNQGQSISCTDIRCKNKEEVAQEIGYAGLKQPASLQQLYSNVKLLENSEEAGRYLGSLNPDIIENFVYLFLDEFDELKEKVSSLRTEMEALLDCISEFKDIYDKGYMLIFLSTYLQYIPEDLLRGIEDDLIVMKRKVSAFALSARKHILSLPANRRNKSVLDYINFFIKQL